MDMSAAKHNDCEDRRIQWATYKKLCTCFDNWGKDLVELEFAYCDADRKVIIESRQFNPILNFDETCLSHDGLEGNRGGRPDVYIFDPHHP